MDAANNNGPGRNALQTRHLYTLHGEIAWGGMASVRLARQSGPHGWSRIVAVKNLLSRTAPDSEFVAMFRDEIRVACRVNHPNVVPVLDVVTADEQLLLVMEYVHGESVARLLKRSRIVMPPKIACTIMIGVLRGLHAAHEALTERGEPLHIVHRDVTPHNMIVGVDGTPRLLDFGIAHATGRRHETRVGHLKGKLAYMAPEQLLDGTVDRRVDIYAASVTLWEMLAGRRLFEGHKDKILSMILHHSVEPPGAFQAGISSQLDAIVLRGLNRDPRQRYETAREMAVALEREVETVSATELGDWVRRTWGAAGHRREEQIRAIEGAPPPPVRGDGATTQNTTVDEPMRRLPSSQDMTRPLALGERRPPRPARRQDRSKEDRTKEQRSKEERPRQARSPERSRLDTPTATFGERRRVSEFGKTLPPPAHRARSVFSTWAPILLVVAVGSVLAGRYWPGASAPPQREQAPAASLSMPAPRLPNIEPLPERMSSALPDDPTPTAVGPLAPTSAAAPVREESSAVLPPAGPPKTTTPTRVARPHQKASTAKRRTTANRAPQRASASAALRASDRTGALGSPLVDPMGTPMVRATVPSTRDCDPPYVIDRAGIKRFKLACL